MNEKLQDRVRRASETIKPSYGLAYARRLYKASAQGFYLCPNEKFDLFIICLRKAGYDIK